MPEITTPAISKPTPTSTYTFGTPAHTATSINARESYDRTFDFFTVGGRKAGEGAHLVAHGIVTAVVGEKSRVNGAAHQKFALNEGALGNLLIATQTVLGEVGAIIGAIAGVLVAGGKTVIGQSTAGTISSHVTAGKNLASTAAQTASSPFSASLNYTRFILGETIKILPAVGAVVGGAAGTIIGSVTGVLTGIVTIFNIRATPINTSAAPSTATGATATGV